MVGKREGRKCSREGSGASAWRSEFPNSKVSWTPTGNVVHVWTYVLFCVRLFLSEPTSTTLQCIMHFHSIN